MATSQLLATFEVPFVCCIRGSLLKFDSILAKVPQESILVTVIYTLSTADIPLGEETLQHPLNQSNSWNKNWKIKLVMGSCYLYTASTKQQPLQLSLWKSTTKG